MYCETVYFFAILSGCTKKNYSCQLYPEKMSNAYFPAWSMTCSDTATGATQNKIKKNTFLRCFKLQQLAIGGEDEIFSHLVDKIMNRNE